MTHRNAPLSVEGRRRLVERLRHPSIAHVAAEMGISRATASTRVDRSLPVPFVRWFRMRGSRPISWPPRLNCGGPGRGHMRSGGQVVMRTDSAKAPSPPTSAISTVISMNMFSGSTRAALNRPACPETYGVENSGVCCTNR